MAVGVPHRSFEQVDKFESEDPALIGEEKPADAGIVLVCHSHDEAGVLQTVGYGRKLGPRQADEGGEHGYPRMVESHGQAADYPELSEGVLSSARDLLCAAGGIGEKGRQIPLLGTGDAVLGETDHTFQATFPDKLLDTVLIIANGLLDRFRSLTSAFRDVKEPEPAIGVAS